MRARLTAVAALAAVLLFPTACTDSGSTPFQPLPAPALARAPSTTAPVTTWTVETLIDALFTTQNRQSAQSSWRKIVNAKTASPVNVSALKAAVTDITKWTLTRLGANQLNDPDGAGPLNATTGAMKLLAMIYGYAGYAATELPPPPTGTDMNYVLVGPTSPETIVTSSLGDGQVVIPPGTFPTTVLIIIARQPASVTVNTPYPIFSRVFDVSIAPEVSFPALTVAICPFAAVPHDVNQRAVIAHQKTESVVEYLPRATVSTLVCPEDIGSAWREQDGVVRQRLAQLAGFARSALGLLAPKSAYAGHGAIGSLLESLSPSVIVDPYVATTLSMPALTGVTYGASVSASATLHTASGAPLAGSAVTFTADGDPATAQVGTTDASGVATASLAHLGAGEHTVAASFAGGPAPTVAPLYGASGASAGVTVAKAPLTASADNLTREYGLPNPPLTGSVTGVQYGESVTASYTTEATAASPVGSYPIVPSVSAAAGVLDNYLVQLNSGTLGVTPAPLTVSYQSQSFAWGTGTGCVVTYTGFRLSDGPGSLGGTLGCAGPDGPLADPFPVGTYVVTPGGLSSGNYAISYVSGTLTVTRRYGALVFRSPVALGDQRAGYQRGSNIVVAFRLYAPDGSAITDAVATVAMSGVAVAPGSVAFTYDPVSQVYQTGIKTASDTAVGTHVITVFLDDGTTRTVEVEVK